MLLGLVIILFTSFNSITLHDKLLNFHIKAAGVQKVLEFESKFPEIVEDDAVYLAYLQAYYKDNKTEYLNLFNI